MKAKSIIVLMAVLLFGVIAASAQTDSDAKNLYFGYKPRPAGERRQGTRVTTTTTTTVHTQTTVSANGGNRNSGAGRSRESSRPRSTGHGGSNSNAVAPVPTGLPGTKVTIELSRNGKLSFVKPTFKFRSGDKIRLRLRTNFEGYVSVLNLGSSGNIHTLYPVQGSDNYVRPTSDYQIPGGNGWIVFDNNPGTEIISVIMSEDELRGLEGLKSDAGYFHRDRTGKDLFVQSSGNDTYAVFQQDESDENVGFMLKLKHK
jgi:hypothetical protein